MLLPDNLHSQLLRSRHPQFEAPTHHELSKNPARSRNLSPEPHMTYASARGLDELPAPRLVFAPALQALRRMQANMVPFTPAGGSDPSSPPAKAKRRVRRHRKGSTLQFARVLKELAGKDSRCVILVKKVNRLGFEANSALRKYFAEYGTVKDIYMAYPAEQHLAGNPRFALQPCPDLVSPHVLPDISSPQECPSSQQPPCAKRLRPAGMGFVLMERAEGAARALAQGREHDVEGKIIVVLPFESRGAGDAEGDATHGNTEASSSEDS